MRWSASPAALMPTSASGFNTMSPMTVSVAVEIAVTWPADDAKAGHVTAISTATDTVIGDIVLNPLADVGIKAAGDALQRIAPPANPAPEDFKFTVGAYPNQLNNIAIHGQFAFVPNT